MAFLQRAPRARRCRFRSGLTRSAQLTRRSESGGRQSTCVTATQSKSRCSFSRQKGVGQSGGVEESLGSREVEESRESGSQGVGEARSRESRGGEESRESGSRRVGESESR